MPTSKESYRDFLISLDDIEFENITYFILRPPDNEEDNRDLLSNHYKFEMVDDKAYFGFLEKSDLPYKIRKQCFARFGYYFPFGDVVGKMFKW